MGAALPGLALSLALGRSVRYAVKGWSMWPTLAPGDWLLVLPWPRWTGGPRPGWMVVAQRPDRPAMAVVKRVAHVDPAGRLTLLGDTPEASTDSREFGPVEASLVVGVVWARYWPPRRATLFGRGMGRSLWRALARRDEATAAGRGPD